MKRESYERLGYEGTEMFPDPVTHFETLSSEDFDAIFQVQMKWATEKPCRYVSHNGVVSAVRSPRCHVKCVSSTDNDGEPVRTEAPEPPPLQRPLSTTAAAGSNATDTNVLIAFFGVDRCPAVTAERIKVQVISPITQSFRNTKAIGHFNNLHIINSPHSGEQHVSVNSFPGSQLGLDLIAAEEPESPELRAAINAVACFPFRGVPDTELTMRRNALSQLWSLKRLRRIIDVLYPTESLGKR